MLPTAQNKQVFSLQPEQPWFVLSASQKYSLMRSENQSVSHFYSFKVSRNAINTLAIPDGCVDILFDCNDSKPVARVCGSPLEAREVELIPGHDYFGVRFKPGALPAFLNLSAEELTDNEYSFLDVIPDGYEAFERIVSSSVLPHRIYLFNQYFNPDIVRSPCLVSQWAIDEIIRSRGCIRMDKLETLTGYTCRTIQRLFRQDTGMSPKAFSRIIRFQYALNTINKVSNITFCELALDLGFSDQSHFLREFKKLVSTTPLEYQRRITIESYNDRIRYH
ncbi:AraC family transcriptional regulator [Mixta theicola]|uniref:AraC family transcriptional regulator n=1 Tax=Mixta theicola TaxID=1458355 RepID=A0A2K1QDH1_9GAMM|nr:helix-turn-helix domain-containing protein [Mixta theicola]PNS13079.1 AraC family transcriptional regulator [Mixta theicola]GLR09345.1 transcriptional regulator [Mixta theicola]